MLESFKEGLKEELNNVKEIELPKAKKYFKSKAKDFKRNFKPWCKKVKEKFKKLWSDIKLSYIENKKLAYLNDEEKKLHTNMKKELKNYIFEDEELLFETTKINKQKLLKYLNPLNILETMDCILFPYASYFITDKRVIILSTPNNKKRKLDMHINSYYYSDISNVCLIENNADKHNIFLSPKGTSFSDLNIIIHPCVSKHIYRIISTKVHEHLKKD